VGFVASHFRNNSGRTSVCIEGSDAVSVAIIPEQVDVLSTI
jgi:hypothetical protein